MPSDAARLVQGLRDAHDRLFSFAAGMDAGDLERPSYCDGWTIAQVLSHIGSAAEIGRATLRAALGGQEPLDQAGRQAIWDRWDAKSPAAQVADAGASDDELVEALEGLEQEQLDSLEVPFGGRQLSAAELLRLFLAERALHAWDVEVVFEPSVRLRPAHVDLLLDALGTLVPWYAEATGYAGPDRVAVHTLEPGRDFVLLLNEGVSLLPSGPAGDGVARLELPAEALIRLVYGRLDTEHTPSEVESDGVGLDELRRLFPGR